MPQNIKELANSLPHYPKDIPFIVVNMRGKDNKVENALQWLSQHNPRYKDIQINQEALNHLPENGIPLDIPTFETNTDDILDENSDEDSLTDTELETDSDVVYNKNTETSSFISSQCNEKQEKEVIMIK